MLDLAFHAALLADTPSSASSPRFQRHQRRFRHLHHYPSTCSYEFRFPADTWPSGMLARGSYGAKTTFSDDDGTTHLNFAWHFDIKKDWSS